MHICCSQTELAYNIVRFLAYYWKYFASQQCGTKIETNITLSYQPFLSIIQRQQLQHFDEYHSQLRILYGLNKRKYSQLIRPVKKALPLFIIIAFVFQTNQKFFR